MFISVVDFMNISALVRGYRWHIVVMAVRERPFTADWILSSIEDSVGWWMIYVTMEGLR